MLLHEGKTVTINIGSVKSVKILDFMDFGGFANIFKVQDLVTSKLYVLKHIQLKPGVEDKSTLVTRIKNEGSIKIPSKYVISHIGVKEFAKDNYAILSDYIADTQDFGEWILDNKSTDWAQKQALFIKILKGIHDAHSMNVIHRDLKPQNILITKENEPLIIDFGLAKFKDKSITVTGKLLGTMPYLDPSAIIEGSKYVDAKCDIYAMGVVLHQLACGSHYWTVADIEFPQLVNIITLGDNKNIMDIGKVKNGFRGADALRKAIAYSTMFDPSARIKSINELIKLLGEVPFKKSYPTVDYSTKSPVLIIEDGSAKGAMNIIAINDGKTRELNRTNLDITNKSISRRNHAFIERQGDQYFIYEGSGSTEKGTNGTYLNGERLKIGKKHKVAIKHTDRVRFADLWTRFVFLNK